MTASPDDLEGLVPAHVLEGGDLDCGSGLVLLIRENMLQVPEGEVLEMRSIEPTVNDDLPPWCRMVGHEFLGRLDGAAPGQSRYFVRRGSGPAGDDDARALEEDKEKARSYEWRLRARASGTLTTRVYCRNFQWSIGQAASFEEKDENPSAVEALLGALAGDVTTGFATACARAGLDVEDVELTVKGRLHDVTAHLGLGEGDPSFAEIQVKLFASTFDDEAEVRAVFEETLRRSPLVTTLAKSCELVTKVMIV